MDDKYLKLSTNKQAADALSDYDLTINKPLPRTAILYGSLRALKDDTDMINVMKFRARYGLKILVFYQEEDLHLRYLRDREG